MKNGTLPKVELAIPKLFSVGFEVIGSAKTEIHGQIAGGSEVLISYKTLPGNAPATNGNFMAIWQDTRLPYVYTSEGGIIADPIQRDPIMSNNQTGSQPFRAQDIQAKPYIVGYGTGEEITSVCSTLTFMPSNEPIEPTFFATTIEVEAVYTDFITLRFDTPSGNRPQTNNNWIGVWEGLQAAFNCSGLVNKQRVNTDRSRDVMSIAVPVRLDTDYTIGYATGPACSDIAAYVQIRTS